MNRRNFIQGTAVGVGAVLITESIGCGGKSVAPEVAILTGAVEELEILFPAQSVTLKKIVSLAQDFNRDWTAGKFDTAKDFFLNLDILVNQVITDLGASASTRAKLLLAALGIAVRTIAALISEQGAQEPKAAKTASATAPQAVDRVKQLSNAADASWILKAVQK